MIHIVCEHCISCVDLSVFHALCYSLFSLSFPSFIRVGLFCFLYYFLKISCLYFSCKDWHILIATLFLIYITFISDCVKCMRGTSYCAILLVFLNLFAHSFTAEWKGRIKMRLFC